MNKANLKSYAPKARLDFIKAVTERANVLGISAAGVVPAEVRGDVALIDGREWPAKVAGQRDELIAQIKRHGFEQTMDEVAYTWFNRFAALRYMEIHDYLGHGWRVLSSRDGGLPEILRHASEVTLPGLNPDRAREMQLAGNQDNELYKLLLVAQCNELSRVMPFLFERIDDETELLLPENLLRTDSIVAKLVEQVPEEDWQEIEAIGWLYQFYISEKKDQVMGKVVKSEDIPAATQLFTPNWIVQYLVQNSVGRLWLMANPSSTLASQWPYYIQPAEQTPEVQAQLQALIQTRIREDGETLNPETIAVLDPACGSGHILVVAYDVLKAIYLERGYQPRAIPRLILERNLFGLDIDDRAAQLAAFALLMKARADDRRLFTEAPTLNILSLQEGAGLDLDELASHLGPYGLQRAQLKNLLDVFEHAKTLGSLIQIPEEIKASLPAIDEGLNRALKDGDMYAQQAAADLRSLVEQAVLLAKNFDSVIANPPYMGSKGMNPVMLKFVSRNYADERSDLYACFISRCFVFAKPGGFSALVALQNWMFYTTCVEMRRKVISQSRIDSLVQIGFNSFPTLNSKVALAAAFSSQKCVLSGFGAKYFDCNKASPSADKEVVFNELREKDGYYIRTSESFGELPGSPISYWTSFQTRRVFANSIPIADVARARQGLSTSNNERFVRAWHEVSVPTIEFVKSSPASDWRSETRWVPYNKGGLVRRWYGNNEFVVDWRENGKTIKSLIPKAVVRNESAYFKRSITWSDITIENAFRLQDPGFIFANSAHSAFCVNDADYLAVLGILNSPVVNHFINALSQSLHFDVGYYNMLPFPREFDSTEMRFAVRNLVSLATEDWNSREMSWNFRELPIVAASKESNLLSDCFERVQRHLSEKLEKNIELEELVARLAFAAYGLPYSDEYKNYHPKPVVEVLQRRSIAESILSYCVGCVFGRFSLDEPGLIYANRENVGFDVGRYRKLVVDADGILPITDEPWFEGEAASRVREFLGVVWGAESLELNMSWLAESLGTKSGQTPDQALRRYLSDHFFRDHLQAYKKRPIYWLFTSGKQGAFQALVYLHRYNEGTLARMRAEYVVPLIAKMASRLEMLDKDVAAASSAAARTKLQKQIEALRKKQIELLAYDEMLRHYADMRIALDLDDGVKVNYAKFGDLVAESKAITGGSDE